jgi:2,4-dienoyl-CoA reductase-like NADH-dependent reductase (Old Yellow Enzyme family)
VVRLRREESDVSMLFEEAVVGGLTVKNRFVRSATWEVKATQEGRPTDALAECIAELGEGDVGLIVVGHAYVLPNGRGTPLQTGIHRDDFAEDLAKIPARAQRQGSRVVLQISHCGGHAKSAWISGTLVAPSAYENLYGDVARELTEAEILEIVDAFGEAGRRARDAGFDGVQLHAAHGYLINQFLSPVWNQRPDAYGGSLENRGRFLFEICRRLQGELGDEFPILVKLTSEDFIEGGFTLDGALWVAKTLAEMGVSAIEVSGGSRYSGSMSHIRTGVRGEGDEAWFADSAKRIKQEIQVPVLLVGGIRSFEVAEKLVGEGYCDFVAMSRPFICEPRLVSRWMSGDRTRSRCVSDNLCFGPAYEGRGLWCERAKG